MAYHHHDHTNRKSLLDTLYCSEAEEDYGHFLNNSSPASPPFLLQSDMFSDEQELTSLLGKEHHNPLSTCLQTNPALDFARREAVEWILKVNSHYSFSALTAVLSVNYFDRFLFSFRFQNDKPWMVQLAAVACLSIAAKVEETHVPFLIDLQQVDESRYLFEAKTIKKMEILVLSTLGWKMNPPTPLSFLDYFTRRLGSKDHLCWEFLSKSQGVLLSLLGDSRFMSYLPSVLATATMMHVVKSVEPGLEAEYKSQLFGILRIDKEKPEKVNSCCKLLLEVWSGYEEEEQEQGKQCMKRKFGIGSIPGSPNGVMDVSFSCDSSSNDSSVSSSPEPLSKKSRSEEQEQLLLPNPNHSNSDFLHRL
ncbi:Cyclin-D3-2 [Glycine soja]|uniref:B-like cyclin n=1 Tax=Glycine soja TaxID=3848 RepID=A0A0B2SEI9_GLYSO|nr:Cyclin-D3-2 [Glycine soja]